MSATVPTPNTPAPAKSFLAGLSAVNVVLTLALAVGGALATAGLTYGGLVARLASVEQTVTSNKAEREKSVDEIRGSMVSRERYEADMKAVEDIRQTVKEIRRDQIEDLRRRADAIRRER